MHFTDSHCHLDFPEFQTELPQLLAQCSQQNIGTIVVPSVSPQYWQRVLDLCQQTQPVKLWPCLGIHPWYLKNLTEDNLLQLSQMVEQHLDDIVAIGEIGLDGTIAEQQDNLSQQIAFFEYQLYLANQISKPVIIHHRKSHNETIARLKSIPVVRGGIIHGFSGSFQQGITYIEMGFKLGIGGTITYPRAKKTINAVKRFPLSALVLETDAPAMPIHGEQGQHNSPLTLPKVFESLCQLRSESKEQIAQALEENIADLLPIC